MPPTMAADTFDAGECGDPGDAKQLSLMHKPLHRLSALNAPIQFRDETQLKTLHGDLLK
jgi:hypothetical protein